MVPPNRNQRLSIAIDEGISVRMIFKYCAWPEEAKESDKVTVLKNGDPNSPEKDQNFNEKSTNSKRKEYKITNAVLRYCPCAFRCRQSIGVAKEDEDSISTVVTTANTTPVIPLTLNTNNDTMYVYRFVRNLM